MSSPFRVKNKEQPRDDAAQHELPPLVSANTSLGNAIESASHTQLVEIVRQLCSHSRTAAEMTVKHLVLGPPPAKLGTPKMIDIPSQIEASKQITLRSILKKPGSFERSSQQRQSSSVEPPLSSTEPPPSSQSITSSGKRKATTQCRNCGFAFGNLRSFGGVTCVHHPGKREVNPDHEVWDDFDPDEHGDAWTLMEYEEFASGFQWSCCKREVGEEGCVVGKHEAAPVADWKRARR